MPDPIVPFAETTARRQYRQFGMHAEDRLSHIYIVGKTGVGKSSLIERLALTDLAGGTGFALIDPHGELAASVATACVSVGRPFTYIDATDPTLPFGFNPLRHVRDDKIPLAASGLLETLRKLWPDAWGVRMEHVLRNAVYALLERPNSTLPDVLRLFVDKPYRKEISRGLRNPVVKTFWTTEFEKLPDRLKSEMIAPVQNKMGALLADPTLYRILAAPQVDIRFRSLMQDGGIVLLNVAKGILGEQTAGVLGSFFTTILGLSALSRADIAPSERRPFYLYADEFHNFTTLAFVSMMAELRKYGLGLTLAHQHLHQLDPDVRHAIFGNAGTFMVFRVGAEDAPMLARELQPTFSELDLLNLPQRTFYVRLMINGVPSLPFSARTLFQNKGFEDPRAVSPV